MATAAATRAHDVRSQVRDTQHERAYSVLNIKEVQPDKRIIRGVATSPEPDRMGDVIEPLGVEFKNPLPLLWQHKSAEPIGTVKFDKPTEDGITFEARLPNVEEPGRLKDRIDEAWQSIKLGLVRAVSIGFRAIEFAFMKETDGIRFIKTEVLELSLVTIPANAHATIAEIKAIDSASLAASGIKRESAVLIAASGTKRSTGTGTAAMTLQEQITEWQNKRAASAARMSAIMQKAAEDGSTLSTEDSEEYDRLETEVKKIDEHLVRLNRLEATNKAAAKPIVVKDLATGSHARTGNGSDDDEDDGTQRGNGHSVITVRRNLPAATAFTRYVIALVAARGDPMRAHAIAERKEWADTPEVATILKAAVSAGTTTDPSWAGPLITYQNMASEFIELLRGATIIGRIPGLRRVPFNIQMPRTTTGSSVNWVGEGAPKPVSAMAFDTVQLRWAKAAGIVVLTDELVRFSNPSAEAIVRNDLTEAMAAFLDRDFVDPAKAEVANVSPASITNGVTPVPASGTTAAALRADVRTLMNQFLTANLSLAGAVWIMTEAQANSIAMMQNALGQPAFPGIEGGTFFRIPIVASENIPSTSGSPTEGFPIILAKASEIMLADDGGVSIDASREASVQMDTSPDSPPTGATNLVSLWQLNMTGLKAERFINWKKRRANAVGYISGAKYAE